MEENFNIHLGKKLRMRRLSLGLTQTKVAQAINVTFQQIQKYEKGTNGVSSNRLMQLSQFLKVPIIYFFEDFKEFKDVINIKVRSTGRLLKAKINILKTSADVEILDKETGISPGQACVFYSKDEVGDKVLGGGWIDKTFNNNLST